MRPSLALLAVLLALLVLGRRRRPPSRAAELVHPDAAALLDEAAPREMVQDPVCEAFVAKSSALTTLAEGRVWFFCSSGCYRAFLLGRRRAAGA